MLIFINVDNFKNSKIKNIALFGCGFNTPFKG